MSVFCLGADDIDRVLPAFIHHIERIERETEHLLADGLIEDLKAASKQLWGFQEGDAIKAISITRVSKTSRGGLCEVVAAAGRTTKKETKQVLAEIEQWARSIGCTRVRFGGRRGWKRFVDYAEVGIILEKEL